MRVAFEERCIELDRLPKAWVERGGNTMIVTKIDVKIDFRVVPLDRAKKWRVVLDGMRKQDAETHAFA